MAWEESGEFLTIPPRKNGGNMDIKNDGAFMDQLIDIMREYCEEEDGTVGLSEPMDGDEFRSNVAFGKIVTCKGLSARDRQLGDLVARHDATGHRARGRSINQRGRLSLG